MSSVPFRKIVCEFGPVRSGPFREIVDPRSPVVVKSYFVLDTEDGLNNDFKRHAYQQLGKSNVTTIIHYIGDETVAVAFSHRSSSSSKIFYGTISIRP